MTSQQTASQKQGQEDTHWPRLASEFDRYPVPDFEYTGPPLNFDLTPIFLDSPSSYDSDSTQEHSPLPSFSAKEVEVSLEANPLRRKRLGEWGVSS